MIAVFDGYFPEYVCLPAGILTAWPGCFQWCATRRQAQLLLRRGVPLRRLFAGSPWNGNPAKKVELLPAQKGIHLVGPGETSKRGRWQSQLKHGMSNF